MFIKYELWPKCACGCKFVLAICVQFVWVCSKGKFFSEGVGEMSKHQTNKPKNYLKLLFPVNRTT